MDSLTIEPLGDTAWLVRGADFRYLAAARDCPGVTEANVAYGVLGLYVEPKDFDPELSLRRLRGFTPPESAIGRLVEVPVVFDGEDLLWVAEATGLTSPEVVALMTRGEFQVAAIGFRPGFPYLTGLPEPLHGLPRLPEPRVRVPAGSVAITGRQAGIYPDAGPGGWRLLGRTPCRTVSVADGYFPVAPGDRLRFVAISVDDAERLVGRNL